MSDSSDEELSFDSNRINRNCANDLPPSTIIREVFETVRYIVYTRVIGAKTFLENVLLA